VKVSLHVHVSVVLCCTLLFSTILTSLWGSHFFLMLLVDSRNNCRCLIHLLILILVAFLSCYKAGFDLPLGITRVIFLTVFEHIVICSTWYRGLTNPVPQLNVNATQTYNNAFDLHLHRICLFLSLFNWHWLVFIPLPLRITFLSGSSSRSL